MCVCVLNLKIYHQPNHLFHLFNFTASFYRNRHHTTTTSCTCSSTPLITLACLCEDRSAFWCSLPSRLDDLRFKGTRRACEKSMILRFPASSRHTFRHSRSSCLTPTLLSRAFIVSNLFLKTESSRGVQTNISRPISREKENI